MVAVLLSNWHFLLGRVLKYWFLVRRFLRKCQRRNGFWAVNLGSVFRLGGNLDSRVEVELVRSHLEKRLENRFIVHRANEAGT